MREQHRTGPISPRVGWVISSITLACVLAGALLFPVSASPVAAFQFCGPGKTYDERSDSCVTFCREGERLDTATDQCVPIGTEPDGGFTETDGSDGGDGDDNNDGESTGQFADIDGDRYDTDLDPETGEQYTVECDPGFQPNDADECVAICEEGFRWADGDCIEILNPGHPCVAAGRVPPGITTNAQLAGYAYLPGTGECVTAGEFARRLANFEASASDEKDAVTLLTDISSDMLMLEADLVGIEQRLEEARTEFSEATTAAWLAEQGVEEAADDLDRVEAELADQRAIFELQAVAAYMDGGDIEQFSPAIGGAESTRELSTSREYSEAVLADRDRVIRDVEDLEAETQDRRDRYSAAQESAQADADKAAELEERLVDVLRQQEATIDQQNLKLTESAELVSDIRGRKSEFAAQLGTFDGASREVEEILLEAELFSGRASTFDGDFFPPVDPVDLVSGFGPRLHPLLGYVRNHDGVDLDAPFGVPIYAAAAGEVVIAGTMGGYGSTVVLDHGEGLGTLYAHASAVVVDPGAEVAKGEIIAYIGSTGLSTGPHLHWEVRLNGVAVDPATYMGAMIEAYGVTS